MDIQVFQDSIKSLSLSAESCARLVAYGELLKEKNKILNLISRKDIDAVYSRHILHAVSLAFYFQFFPTQRILDVGSGGGIPGIPLAILFPESHFFLAESIQKKAMAMKEFAQKLGLANVEILARNVTLLDNPHRVDTVTARAVAPLENLTAWTRHLLKKKKQYPSSGYLFFKGGNLEQERQACSISFHAYALGTRLPHLPYYEEKYLLHAS